MQLEVLSGVGALQGGGVGGGSGHALLAQCGNMQDGHGSVGLTISFASGVQMGVRRCFSPCTYHLLKQVEGGKQAWLADSFLGL